MSQPGPAGTPPVERAAAGAARSGEETRERNTGQAEEGLPERDPDRVGGRKGQRHTQAGEDAYAVRDRAVGRVERDLESRGLAGAHESRVRERELARTAARAVVPGNTDEGFANFPVADFDRRAESARPVRHGGERALDSPGAATRNADDERRTVRPE